MKIHISKGIKWNKHTENQLQNKAPTLVSSTAHQDTVEPVS